MPNLSDYDPAVKYGANLDVNVDLADIRDANNNELLELDTVASAVNYVQIANSAAGNAPAFTVAGDDTNVSLQLSPKGTGIVLIGDQGSVLAVQAAGGILAVTMNTQRGVITVPALDIKAASAVIIDLTNSRISGTSLILVSIANTSNATGTPFIRNVDNGAGSATIRIEGAGIAVVNQAIDVNFLVY